MVSTPRTISVTHRISTPLPKEGLTVPRAELIKQAQDLSEVRSDELTQLFNAYNAVIVTRLEVWRQVLDLFDGLQVLEPLDGIDDAQVRLTSEPQGIAAVKPTLRSLDEKENVALTEMTNSIFRIGEAMKGNISEEQYEAIRKFWENEDDEAHSEKEMAQLFQRYEAYLRENEVSFPQHPFQILNAGQLILDEELVFVNAQLATSYSRFWKMNDLFSRHLKIIYAVTILAIVVVLLLPDPIESNSDTPQPVPEAPSQDERRERIRQGFRRLSHDFQQILREDHQELMIHKQANLVINTFPVLPQKAYQTAIYFETDVKPNSEFLTSAKSFFRSLSSPFDQDEQAQNWKSASYQGLNFDYYHSGGTDIAGMLWNDANRNDLSSEGDVYLRSFNDRLYAIVTYGGISMTIEIDYKKKVSAFYDGEQMVRQDIPSHTQELQGSSAFDGIPDGNLRLALTVLPEVLKNFFAYVGNRMGPLERNSGSTWSEDHRVDRLPPLLSRNYSPLRYCYDGGDMLALYRHHLDLRGMSPYIIRNVPGGFVMQRLYAGPKRNPLRVRRNEVEIEQGLLPAYFLVALADGMNQVGAFDEAIVKCRDFQDARVRSDRHLQQDDVKQEVYESVVERLRYRVIPIAGEEEELPKQEPGKRPVDIVGEIDVAEPIHLCKDFFFRIVDGKLLQLSFLHQRLGRMYCEVDFSAEQPVMRFYDNNSMINRTMQGYPREPAVSPELSNKGIPFAVHAFFSRADEMLPELMEAISQSMEAAHPTVPNRIRELVANENTFSVLVPTEEEYQLHVDLFKQPVRLPTRKDFERMKEIVTREDTCAMLDQGKFLVSANTFSILRHVFESRSILERKQIIEQHLQLTRNFGHANGSPDDIPLLSFIKPILLRVTFQHMDRFFVVREEESPR